MEKDLDEVKLEEYKRVKSKLLDAFTQYEEITDDNYNKSFVPLFRKGQKYATKINQLETIDALYPTIVTEYDDELAQDGFTISIDDDGYITNVSQKLENYQNFEIDKRLNKDKLLIDKIKVFNDLGISSKTEELNDVLKIDKDDIGAIKMYDFDSEIDDEEYQKFYKKYLKMYLTKLKENNDVTVFFKENHSVKQTLSDFDNYIKGLVSYELNRVDVEPITLPDFGGLTKDSVKSYVKYYFEPTGSIKTDRLFHNNNHLAMIKGYTLEQKQQLVETCKTNVEGILDKYKGLIAPSMDDKINVLLNAREYITASKKAYKSYNWFRRLVNKDNCKDFRDAREKLINDISTTLNLSVRDCKKFFNNNKPNINYNGKVYNYNTLFDNSKNLEDGLDQFAPREEEVNKVNISVDSVNEDISIEYKKTDINQDLNKYKNLDSSR